jgi:hypothetical protein
MEERSVSGHEIVCRSCGRELEPRDVCEAVVHSSLFPEGGPLCAESAECVEPQLEGVRLLKLLLPVLQAVLADTVTKERAIELLGQLGEDGPKRRP